MKVVSVDQGTTGTKSFTLDESGRFAAIAAVEHRQTYPRAGWVEHDPEELLQSVRACLEAAGPVDAIGIDNQGETVVAWDSKTGKPIYNAIVWQDDRTQDLTEKLKSGGAEELTLKRAGLPLDPYFSASKLRWFIDHVDEARQLLKQGRLRLGTSDAFFLDRLTGTFATDVTTASRTSLMSLDACQWDADLCQLFGVPLECLPEIRPSASDFGSIGKAPVTASIVDQQAALFGHGSSAKITFGTGAFALVQTGEVRVDGSKFGILSTIACKLGREPVQRAIEGGVYNAASAVNWARGLGLFKNLDEISSFDNPSALSRNLVFVPALSGLGCPHWDRNAAGLWIGMGLETTAKDLVQAVLEGVALRAAEVIAAMAELTSLEDSISIDGGLTKNAYFNRFLANALGKTVVVQGSPELTGYGTARLAMKGAGIKSLPPLPPPQSRIMPNARLDEDQRAHFGEAVSRAKGWKK
jgi:glycerol kinase